MVAMFGTRKFSRRRLLHLTVLATTLLALGCGGTPSVAADEKVTSENKDKKDSDKMAIATFGGGCFWCVEAVFERLEGVGDVVSGYEGGSVPNPTYEQVCGKKTGHIEVCQIHYDPSVITFDELLEIFFKIHDPTSRDRQGADAGPQYRSVIFYHDDEQKRVAEEHIKKVNESRKLGRLIVTEVLPTETFYVAEEYHQDYFAKNPFGGYCQAVVRPKVEKVESEFADQLKK
jgi:peptide-methionine (S)-S-oxide reductase